MADTAYVVDGGLGYVTGLMLAAGATEANHIGWGIGTTAATVADDDLESESVETRTEGTSTQQTTNTSNDTYRVVGTIVDTVAIKEITEVALFTAVTSGTMLMRATFSAINVSIDDSIQFTINNVLNQA